MTWGHCGFVVSGRAYLVAKIRGGEEGATRSFFGAITGGRVLYRSSAVLRWSWRVAKVAFWGRFYVSEWGEHRGWPGAPLHHVGISVRRTVERNFW